MRRGVGGGAAGCALSAFAYTRESTRPISDRCIVSTSSAVARLGSFPSGTHLDTTLPRRTLSMRQFISALVIAAFCATGSASFAQTSATDETKKAGQDRKSVV